MDVYMEPLPVIPFIEPERGVRQSVQIATGDDLVESDSDDDSEPRVIAPPVISVSPCGGANAEVDQDGDGDVDWCRNLGGTAYRGSCPALLVAVDQDGDGTLDRCVAQARPDGSTDPNTTTTTAPVATDGDGEELDGDLADADGNDVVPDTNEPQTPEPGAPATTSTLPPIVPAPIEPAGNG